MASYKQPCIHCGEFIDRDARLCPKCASRSPFGYLCPACLHPVEKSRQVCPGCGRPLHILCPACLNQTFAAERCEACGASLATRCQNPRCGEMQFFENERCTACGNVLKGRRKHDA